MRKEISRLPGAPNLWLHRYACLVAFFVLSLISLGGLVTSHNAGMSVPDWPTSYGYNMFFFPLERMVGPIMLEHSHRLLASLVGLLTISLAIWITCSDARLWLRWTAWAAVGAVVLQGVLGGLRVVWAADWIGIFHAGLAHSFFVLIGFIALSTSDFWAERIRIRQNELKLPFRPVLWACLFLFLQLLLGASMRHQHAGLAVPDFPTAYGSLWPDLSDEHLAQINEQRVASAQMKVTRLQIYLHLAHRVGALVVFFGVLSAAMAIHRMKHLPNVTRNLAATWAGLVILQVLLGIFTVLTNKGADIATAHAVVGALLLQCGGLLVAMLYRLRYKFEREKSNSERSATPPQYVFSYRII